MRATQRADNRDAEFTRISYLLCSTFQEMEVLSTDCAVPVSLADLVCAFRTRHGYGACNLMSIGVWVS